MAQSLWSTARAILAALPARRRREAAATCGLLVIGASAEAVSLGAVLPFLAVLTNPDRARRLPVVGELLAALPAETDPVMATSIAFFALLLLSGALRLYLTWRTLALSNAMSYDLSLLAFRKIIRQPYAYYLGQNSSKTLTGFDMISAITNSVLQPAMQAIAATIAAVVLLATLMLIAPIVASTAALVIAGTYLLTSLAARRTLERNSRIFSQAWTARIKSIQEAIGGIRNILLDRSQPAVEQTFERAVGQLRGAVTVNSYISHFPRIVVEMAAVALIAGMVWFLANRPAGLIAMIPTLGAIAACGQRLLPLLQSAYWGLSQMRGSEESLQEVARILALEEEYRPPADDEPRLLFTSAVELVHVGLRFTAGGPVLSDVSLAIRKGERIGIVGPTGAGKSTLTDVLLGLLTPTTGQLLIDGQALSPVTLSQWQKTVAHVPQSIFLADDTLAANIAFGQASDAVDLERVREAAERAGIAAFIASLPDGYATVCGERGVRLSGGQRQRIGIARALYKQASFLVFDEATSALDSETERQVMAAIAALSSNITVVIVAHRLTTLADCDRIVHLASGRITRIEESRPALA